MKLIFTLFFIFMLSACQMLSTTEPVSSEASITGSSNNQPNSTNLNKSINTPSNHQKNYENVWLKLAENFDFEVPENERIKKQRDYFLSHPNYLKRVSKRAEPFLWLIVDRIEKNDLPLELALLPVIESTFDPFARSHAGAVGLWQFMPTSGARFGLQQNEWYDGRRDVVASTEGALKYMQFLHRFLGEDWLYAVAAYNSGEGTVQNAVRKNKRQNKPADYWNLNLPRETELYVPKLLALIDILRNHEQYNIELPYIPNQKVLSYVDTGSQIDLDFAAELAGLSFSEIELLNPAFKLRATSPNGPHKLLLPNDSVAQFQTKLAKVNKNGRVHWNKYLVKSGDSLSVIAQKKNTTVHMLKEVNHLNSELLKIGQPLLIPQMSLSQQQLLANQKHARGKKFDTSNKQKIVHRVTKGDTLWELSKFYKVSSIDIAKWNNFPVSQNLSLGQKLTIWKGFVAKKSQKRVTYHVLSGDSLGVIAQKFQVKTADLMRWNNLNEKQYIQPGQKLNIYVTKTSS
ncbi:lytic transglycosylase [Psychromonas aquatilis]|uniref:LysM peptidoglycan-binding domain-containing protein n=1 Tax=Psychromonas aquatilis TaxID=2005072 RepID=A0ABU9GL74_9GAMM